MDLNAEGTCGHPKPWSRPFQKAGATTSSGPGSMNVEENPPIGGIYMLCEGTKLSYSCWFCSGLDVVQLQNEDSMRAGGGINGGERAGVQVQNRY